MRNQLLELGIKNIVFIDNGSTDARMIALLRESSDDSIELNENIGPRALIYVKQYFDALPELFCITDPDIIFNEGMPPGFLENFLAISDEARCGKVGLALRIDDAEKMRDVLLSVDNKQSSVIDWEKRHWQMEYKTDVVTDQVFVADIDTTFALYNKRYFRRLNFYTALRVAGRYTARHDPWYKSRLISDEDAKVYANHQQFSTLFKRRL